MGQYTIKDLEKLSRVKAHTIRIWEKRYGLLSPSRSSTHLRAYNDDDLRRLLNIALLNNRGLKLSRIALRELGSQGLIPGVVKSSW